MIEVVVNDNSEKEYVTKGDANNSNDIETIKSRDVEGKYIFKISKLGSVILFLKTRNGIILLLIIFSIILLINNKKANKKEEQ